MTSISAFALTASLGLAIAGLTAPAAMAAGDSAQAQSTQAHSGSLEHMVRQMPKSLSGHAVMTKGGEKLGTIDKFVQKRTSDQIYAVVTPSDFASGQDVHQSVVPLSKIEKKGDDLILMSQNAENLVERQDYRAGTYEGIQYHADEFIPLQTQGGADQSD